MTDHIYPDGPIATLYVEALEAALKYEASVESNVVQRRIVSEAVSVAIEVLWPYIVLPSAPQQRPRLLARLRDAIRPEKAA